MVPNCETGFVLPIDMDPRAITGLAPYTTVPLIWALVGAVELVASTMKYAVPGLSTMAFRVAPVEVISVTVGSEGTAGTFVIAVPSNLGGIGFAVLKNNVPE